MRAGIFLAYWPWFLPRDQVERAALADGLGPDSACGSEPRAGGAGTGRGDAMSARGRPVWAAPAGGAA